MSNQANDYSILYPKQIASLLDCHLNTAKQIHKDIKAEYQLKSHVLLQHFKTYMKVK